ncbi:hypothetical protein CK203_006166 [Vitis vinifera]|uniref:Protein FMP32, mitochondrial n=1 Tax=Vitis vinifera TaxID=29760 RepID=A0A438K603_VITVI|nr:hypothetical protein CK203_006166 [Vitis vinifera]
MERHHFSLLQHETEKLQIDIETMRTELSHEIDKVTTVVRAELANHNVETITHTSTLDRVLRAELVNQNAETITTTNKLDRDIHAVRAQLEAAKYDVIKYCMGTIVSILALSFAAIRMLM